MEVDDMWDDDGDYELMLEECKYVLPIEKISKERDDPLDGG